MKKIGVKYVSARVSRYMLEALRTSRVTVIAVTGSIGKTSARIAISEMLADYYKLPPIEQNSYNVPIAIEMSFFGQKLPRPLWNGLAWQQIFSKLKTMAKQYPYEYVVIEVNEDDFDELQELMDRIHPHIGIITGVAPAHMEKLKTMEHVVAQTTSLAKYVDTTIYNADFAELAKLKSEHTLSYSLGKNTTVSMSGIERNSKGMLSAKLTIGKKSVQVDTKHVARQSLYSLLAAAAVGTKVGLTIEQIATSLARIEPVRGRMNLLPGVQGARILDDSYNASPVAVVAALDTLADFPAKRRIAVLGSMNELGDHAKDAHSSVGKKAAGTSDMLITIGALAEKYMTPAAMQAGMKPEQVKIFHTPYEAGHYLKEHLTSDDAVLVKGSQNAVFSEEVTRIILAEGIDPKQVLVRQSDGWKKSKKKSFRR